MITFVSDEVTPGLTKQDFADRRKALMKLLYEASLDNKQVCCFFFCFFLNKNPLKTFF